MLPYYTGAAEEREEKKKGLTQRSQRGGITEDTEKN
jgi:hypothetical protein